MSKNIHQRLEEIITAADPGERLPSEPKLAKRLGVSRATLREAMRTFETQGLLRRRQGVGTFVVRPTHIIESGLEILESIERQAAQIGLQVAMGELRVKECVPSEEVAAKLNVEKDAKVICVARVIVAEGRPVAYLLDTVPEHYLTSREVNDHFTGSVLDLLLKRDYPPLGDSRCEINSVAADAEVARALDIQRGDAVLRFESLLYTIEGEPVDYSYSYFLPGYFKFHVVRRVGMQAGLRNTE